jgi:DNA-binding NarL/FixJ family response regulator
MTDSIASLSSRQSEVAGLIAEGATDKDIECQLGLSNGGVRAHINEIAERLQLDRSKNLRAQITSVVVTSRLRASA